MISNTARLTLAETSLGTDSFSDLLRASSDPINCDYITFRISWIEKIQQKQPRASQKGARTRLKVSSQAFELAELLVASALVRHDRFLCPVHPSLRVVCDLGKAHKSRPSTPQPPLRKSCISCYRHSLFYSSRPACQTFYFKIWTPLGSSIINSRPYCG
jgi:hypothetical protein